MADVSEASAHQPRQLQDGDDGMSTFESVGDPAAGPAHGTDTDVAGPDSAGSFAPSHIYALGRIVVRFPTLALEKEFAQATGRASTASLTDRQAVQAVLSDRQNRYLARQLCWVFTIEGQETYLLLPRDTTDYDLLLEALRPTPRPTDVDVVIGTLGPVSAPPGFCSGMMLPIVVFDQLYSFDVDGFIKAVPRPEDMDSNQFDAAAEEVFSRIMQMVDNAGSSDGDRALNYLAVRDPSIYARAAEAFAGNFSLTGVEVRPSRLSGTRTIVDAIFSYTSRQTGVVDRYFARVDVTEEFPFLVSRLAPYYETLNHTR